MTSRKFGGRQPTGTPSVGWSAVVVIASLLAGASIVHNIFKPDLAEDQVWVVPEEGLHFAIGEGSQGAAVHQWKMSDTQLSWLDSSSSNGFQNSCVNF